MSKVYVVKCESCVEDGYDSRNLTGIVSVCTSADLALEHITKAVDLDRKDLEHGGIEYDLAYRCDKWFPVISYSDNGTNIERRYCCEEFETDVFYSDENYGTKEGA